MCPFTGIRLSSVCFYIPCAMTMTEVVEPRVRTCVGALMVLRDEKLRVLLGRRSETRTSYPNVWDVPGGQCERGESPQQALLRELKEEVGVVPTEWRLVGHYDVLAQGPDELMILYFYEVTAWTGMPSNRQPEEHAEIAWFTIDEACQLSLPHPAYVDLFHRLAPVS